jgi:hypothetical protein
MATPGGLVGAWPPPLLSAYITNRIKGLECVKYLNSQAVVIVHASR